MGSLWAAGPLCTQLISQKPLCAVTLGYTEMKSPCRKQSRRGLEVSKLLFLKGTMPTQCPGDMLAPQPGFSQHFAKGDGLPDPGVDCLGSNPNSALVWDLGHIISSLDFPALIRNVEIIIVLTLQRHETARDKEYQPCSVTCNSHHPDTHPSNRPLICPFIHPIHIIEQKQFLKDVSNLESKPIKTRCFEKLTNAKIQHK